MLTAILAMALLADPAPVEKTAVELMDPAVKAARIEKVAAARLAKKAELESYLKEHARDEVRTPEVAARREVLWAEMRSVDWELRWLKGELTPAGTEAAVVAAQAAVDKVAALGQKSQLLAAALERAKAERDAVARLELAETPKAPEPN